MACHALLHAGLCTTQGNAATTLLHWSPISTLSSPRHIQSCQHPIFLTLSPSSRTQATNPDQAARLYGRHFDHKDDLVSKITRKSINVLKDMFRDDLTKDDWRLVVRLKKVGRDVQVESCMESALGRRVCGMAHTSCPP